MAEILEPASVYYTAGSVTASTQLRKGSVIAAWPHGTDGVDRATIALETNEQLVVAATLAATAATYGLVSIGSGGCVLPSAVVRVDQVDAGLPTPRTRVTLRGGTERMTSSAFATVVAALEV